MTKGNLKFCIASTEDAAQLQQLVQSAFRAEDSRNAWSADMDLSSRFRIEVPEIVMTIMDPDSAYLMATDNNGTLVASIGISKRGTNRARLFMLAVDQHHQRGGIGRHVLTYAEHYCEQTWGVRKLELDALSTRQELILWYIRRGYRKTGESTPFPREKYDGLVLPDDICFVQFEKDLSTVPVVEKAAQIGEIGEELYAG